MDRTFKPQPREISRDEWLACYRATLEYTPHVLPPGWTQINLTSDDPLFGLMVYRHFSGLKVLFSGDPLMEPGKTWLHVSLSRKKRIPSYDDLLYVKKIFIGPNRQAIQVFPTSEKHINIHPFCLHLWCCIEGDGLPDFGKEGMI